MEAAGLIEKVEMSKQLRYVILCSHKFCRSAHSFRFNFEDIRKLPPPIIAFDSVAFSYSGKPQDYLYRNLSFGIEYVPLLLTGYCYLIEAPI